MGLPQGIYFRATDNQVDPTNYDAEVGTTANYPRTTAQGVTAGWEGAPTGTRDRTGPTDVRLKGVHFKANTGTIDYRIDLPAPGNYNIGLALGDTSGQNCRARFLDDATQFADIQGQPGGWFDATDVLRTSEADWVANNALLANTFASSIFRVRIGGFTGGSGNTTLAAVYIEAAAGGGTTFQPAWAARSTVTIQPGVTG